MKKILQTGEAVQRREPNLTTVIPVRIKRHGGRELLIQAEPLEPQAPEYHEPMLIALARAHHWQRLLDDGRVANGNEIKRASLWALAAVSLA